MSEDMRDWEAEFEEFDWGSSNDQDSSVSQNEEPFFELFSSLDDVHATDALKQSAIKKAAGQDARVVRHIRLPETTTMWHRRPSNARTPRRARWILPVACIAVILLGVVSWFVPVSSIQISQDDLSVALGVNVYGYTVSAQAKGTVGEQVIASSAIGNRGYGEAIEQLLADYEKMREGEPGGAVSVDVSSPGGIGSEALHRGAEQVIERFDGSGRQEGEQPPTSGEEQTDFGTKGQATQGGAPQQDELPQGGASPMMPNQPEQQGNEPGDAARQESGGNGSGAPNQQPHNDQGPEQAAPSEGNGGMPGAEGFDQGGMQGLGGQGEAPAMTMGPGNPDHGPGV